MSKQSGLGDALFVDGYDLSGDTQALGAVGGGPAALDFTGIDKLAYERQGGVRDSRLEMTNFFNDAAAQAHLVLSPQAGTDRLVTYCRGTALGGAAYNQVSKQVTYDGNRTADGMLLFGVNTLPNAYGGEWATQLTAGKRTDTAATNGTGVDLGTGSLAFGLQAYLHVFAFTGTSVTVKLQESSDNGAGDAWADVTGGGFTVVSAAPGWQRIQTSRTQTVERYLRVVTTGTFSNAVFAVSVQRNDVTVTF